MEAAFDIMGNCSYRESKNIIIHLQNIISDFFDLKTGVAGEILQKFSNYNVRLAIVGHYSRFTSKSLKDFIFEGNKAGRINFVSYVEEARERLIRRGYIFYNFVPDKYLCRTIARLSVQDVKSAWLS